MVTSAIDKKPTIYINDITECLIIIYVWLAEIYEYNNFPICFQCSFGLAPEDALVKTKFGFLF